MGRETHGLRAAAGVAHALEGDGSFRGRDRRPRAHEFQLKNATRRAHGPEPDHGRHAAVLRARGRRRPEAHVRRRALYFIESRGGADELSLRFRRRRNDGEVSREGAYRGHEALGARALRDVTFTRARDGALRDGLRAVCGVCRDVLQVRRQASDVLDRLADLRDHRVSHHVREPVVVVLLPRADDSISPVFHDCPADEIGAPGAALFDESAAVSDAHGRRAGRDHWCCGVAPSEVPLVSRGGRVGGPRADVRRDESDFGRGVRAARGRGSSVPGLWRRGFGEGALSRHRRKAVRAALVQVRGRFASGRLSGQDAASQKQRGRVPASY
mmetsp:Transcript_11508/g.35464  ORF Transcript_11508/g.35464 Transcript_11508/m.35464 type:complete len:328 (-) Transcript_11508:296-1279(-)